MYNAFTKYLGVFVHVHQPADLLHLFHPVGMLTESSVPFFPQILLFKREKKES